MTGTGWILTSRSRLVCLDARATPELIDSLRRAVAVDAGVDEILGVLTADGVVDAPDFLCVAVEADGVRVLVRGGFSAELRSIDGAQTMISSGDSLTWQEQTHAGVRSVIPHAPQIGAVEWFVSSRIVAAPEERTIEPLAPAEPLPTAPEADDAGSLHVSAGPSSPPAEECPSTDPPPIRPSGAGPGEGFDFSNLLEHTRYRDVEAAAVREGSGEEDPAHDDSQRNAPDAEAEPVDVPPVTGVAEPVEQRVEDRTDDGVSGADHQSSERTRQYTEDIAAVPLISGIPPGGEPIRSPESRPPNVGRLGDHDGHTVSVSEVRRMGIAGGEGETGGPGGVQVRAITCGAGHHNPGTAERCRVCDRIITDRTVRTVPRPVVARLRFTTGMVVELDRAQLIGRRPTADAFSLPGGELPGLVTVPSPESDVSRIHTAVRIEGWDVLVEDCGSTNGTEVELPGQERVRLRERDPVLVVPGTQVTLAGVVTFAVEVPA